MQTETLCLLSGFNNIKDTEFKGEPLRNRIKEFD
jgi:hypothetical protein